MHTDQETVHRDWCIPEALWERVVPLLSRAIVKSLQCAGDDRAYRRGAARSHRRHSPGDVSG